MGIGFGVELASRVAIATAGGGGRYYRGGHLVRLDLGEIKNGILGKRLGRRMRFACLNFERKWASGVLPIYTVAYYGRGGDA